MAKARTAVRPRTRAVLLSAFLSVFLMQLSIVRAIEIDKDGGYTDIVVRISNSVPEDSCPKILANIKVTFKALPLRCI
jgi:hypothetical protein